jgi:hypothetical protein
VLDLLRKLTRKGAESRPEPPSPPAQVEAPGRTAFVMAEHVDVENGFPYLRWAELVSWVEHFPESQRDAAWVAVADAWDQHLCVALGADYRIAKAPGVVVISTLDARQAAATLDFMGKVQRRILRTLDGVAEAAGAGNELLVVIDDEDTYYRFISRFYPDGGEYAFSSGVQVNDGGVHYYACLKGHLRDVEPVVAHEMTHGLLAHLPLPLWLNEGLAVNTERRVAQAGGSLHTPAEMRVRHLKFWGADEVQEFWSGKSFRRHDDGNELSYDLARILVEQLSADWPRFAAFARAAHYGDGGLAAAREHLGLDLGAAVAAIMQAPDPRLFTPDPGRWTHAAEHVPEPN